MRIDPDTNTLIREGVESVLNPLDLFPLEAGLRLAEEKAGRVSVFSMGPQQSEKVIHKALAMGADAGYLLSDKKFSGSDTWATSLILAKAIRRVGDFDLVLCGKQAIDGDTGQVGPGIAAHLGIQQATYVVKLGKAAQTKFGDNLQIQRLHENLLCDLQIQLPAVLTILKEANEPRLPTVSGRLKAFHSNIVRFTAEDLQLRGREIGLKGSPTRVDKTQVPQIHRQQHRLEGEGPQHIARVLAEVFNEIS